MAAFFSGAPDKEENDPAETVFAPHFIDMLSDNTDRNLF